MRVLVTGATGYVGGRLVPELLAAGHQVRCLARTPPKLDAAPWRDRVEVVRGDVTDPASLAPALAGVDAAYVLVHSMGGGGGFAERDRAAAVAIRDAAAAAGLGQLVYLGGLGRDDDPDLSPHLRSRHEVGRLLAAGTVPVTELRAAVVIGSGSASFEMLRNLVDVLPVMLTPRWVRTRCQPIAIRDVLFWLVAVLGDERASGRVLEAGGPDVITYQDMMAAYAEEAGLPRRLVVPVPLLTPGLSSLWIGLVTPLPRDLARPLVDSLVNEVVVRDRPVAPLYPDHRPLGFGDALRLALRQVADVSVPTTWAAAEVGGRSPADPLPTDPAWSGGRVLADEQELDCPAAPDALFRTVKGIGGSRGWYAADFLWGVRGFLDQVLGGVGRRRGRRHPDELVVGDVVDFWRVEAVDGSVLRLRAEMRLPGHAWLEWRVTPAGAGSHLHQRARFHPRGLWGMAYWYAMLPFHLLIFRRMAARLCGAAVGSAGDEVDEAVGHVDDPAHGPALQLAGDAGMRGGGRHRRLLRRARR